MEKITTSQITQMASRDVEDRLRLYKNPVVVMVPFIVDIDSSGRASTVSAPDIKNVFGKKIVDDSRWAFKPGQTVYHRMLKQTGTFVEVDELDPSSASVIFKADDGFDDEKRVSLVLLTDQIPKEVIRLDIEAEGIVFSVANVQDSGEILTSVKCVKLGIDATVNARLAVKGQGANKYRSAIRRAAIDYDYELRQREGVQVK